MRANNAWEMVQFSAYIPNVLKNIKSTINFN